MKLVEIKARVEFRLKPLLIPGVRIQYRKAEFSIIEYDYYDSTGTFIINVSDRVDPLEFDTKDIQTFLNELRRKDGGLIPRFDVDGTTIAEGKHKKAPVIKATDEEDEEEEIIPEIPEEEPGSETTQVKPPVKKGKFVHIESTVQVFVTRDYSLFSILQGNRSLNKLKIKRIKEEIAAGTNLLQYCPVIVMEYESKLKVIDGQHRLEVAKQIGSNVWYVVLNEAISLYEIAKMNSNTEKWKAKDFINCYAHTGNANYTILKEFVNTYGFPMSANLQLLTKGVKINEGGNHENVLQQFQQGRFTVKKEAEAIEVANTVSRFSDYVGYKSVAFITAICRIMTAGKAPIEEVIKAYEQHKEELTAQSNYKNYLVNLETIVNIGKGKRRVIY